MKVHANEKFREIRIKEGFTIGDLAEVVGMTKQAIGQIERGLNGVSPKKAKKIIDVLDVEFDDIFKLVDRGE